MPVTRPEAARRNGAKATDPQRPVPSVTGHDGKVPEAGWYTPEAANGTQVSGFRRRGDCGADVVQQGRARDIFDGHIVGHDVALQAREQRFAQFGFCINGKSVRQRGDDNVRAQFALGSSDARSL